MVEEAGSKRTGLVELVVAITKSNVMVFSLSGTEGTPAKPLLVSSALEAGRRYDMAKLSETLAAVATRHWKKEKPAEPALLLVDGEITWEAIVPLALAAREVFPEIVWSWGMPDRDAQGSKP